MHTFAKTFEESHAQLGAGKEYEETPDDLMDIYNYEKDRSTYAVSRKKCKSSLLVQFLNRFGAAGGF